MNSQTIDWMSIFIYCIAQLYLTMIVRCLRQSKHIGLGFAYSFSSVSDPFYILGVSSNAQFSEIKKAFYKLANQYHPDKSDSNESKKKFMLIKEAYEAIKIQKGLMKPKGFIYDEDVVSMRPNPSQFSTSDEEFLNKKSDYKIFREKAEDSQEFESFRGTFKTLDDINEIKVRVERGQMKDPSLRFNLKDKIVKNVRRSENSPTLSAVFLFGALLFFLFFQSYEQEQQSKQINEQLFSQEKRQSHRKIYENETARDKQLTIKAMRENTELASFIQKLLKNSGKQHRNQKQILPNQFQSV